MASALPWVTDLAICPPRLPTTKVRIARSARVRLVQTLNRGSLDRSQGQTAQAKVLQRRARAGVDLVPDWLGVSPVQQLFCRVIAEGAVGCGDVGLGASCVAARRVCAFPRLFFS